MSRDRFLSTSDLARLAGCSYRQADYWARNGALRASRSARGSGSQRGWSADEVALARAFLQLSGHGATTAVLAALAVALDRDPWLWETAAFVTRDGRVRPVEAANGSGWVVDLPACRDYVLAQLGLDLVPA